MLQGSNHRDAPAGRRSATRAKPSAEIRHGIRTESMTWMTPFDCITLAMVIRALVALGVDHDPPAAALHEAQLFALDRRQGRGAMVARGHRRDLLRGDAAGNDMIGQDLGQRRLVLGLHQIIDRAGGELAERGVGRREHGEGPLARQRVDQAGGLDRGDQGRVILRIDRILNDVAGRIHGGAANHRIGRGDCSGCACKGQRDSGGESLDSHHEFSFWCSFRCAAA